MLSACNDITLYLSTSAFLTSCCSVFTISDCVCNNQVNFKFFWNNKAVLEVIKYLDDIGAMPSNFSIITYQTNSWSNNLSRHLSRTYQLSQVTSFCTQFFIHSYLTSTIRRGFHYLYITIYHHYYIIKETEGKLPWVWFQIDVFSFLVFPWDNLQFKYLYYL